MAEWVLVVGVVGRSWEMGAGGSEMLVSRQFSTLMWNSSLIWGLRCGVVGRSPMAGLRTRLMVPSTSSRTRLYQGSSGCNISAITGEWRQSIELCSWNVCSEEPKSPVMTTSPSLNTGKVSGAWCRASASSLSEDGAVYLVSRLYGLVLIYVPLCHRVKALLYVDSEVQIARRQWFPRTLG